MLLRCALALLPGLALSLALLSGADAAGRERDSARSEPVASAASSATESTATRAAACGVHGCGCPHEQVEASCCCADEPSAEPLPRPRAVFVVTPALTAPGLGSGRPVTTLEAFRCSGGKRGRASLDTRTTPAAPSLAGARCELEETRSWDAKVAPGPLFDLRLEPAIPPPR